MRFFTIVQTIAPNSNLQYEELYIAEWRDWDLTVPAGKPVFMMTSVRGRGCQCTPDSWDKATKQHGCVHTAIYATWRRQGRLIENNYGISRVYGVTDGVVCYRKGRELVQLSTVDAVNQSEGAQPRTVRSPQLVLRRL